MKSLLVTGTDTGVGKTHVVAALARVLSWYGGRVQIVKVVETGRIGGAEGDAERARDMAGIGAVACTLEHFAAPLAPPSAAAAEGRRVCFDQLVSQVGRLPVCDWRLLEGAGGVATPLDDDGRDWVDFAREAKVDHIVVVVADRLGAINQARLAFRRVQDTGINAGLWLNATGPVAPELARSNREMLAELGLPIWAEQNFESLVPEDPEALVEALTVMASGTVETAGRGPAESVGQRAARRLAEREKQQIRRRLKVSQPATGVLNLADNDYLALARDPALVAAAGEAARAHGTSASASPLITGWMPPHEQLVHRLGEWHGFRHGLVWSSGFAANSAVLGTLPTRGDVIYADRLIHHSMIAGLLRSGARLRRYEHLRVDQLAEWLEDDSGAGGARFVATESVFSMDGDYPDLRELAALKRRHGFCWIVDEAHGTGWYGPGGGGLVREQGVEGEVDVLVGTLGKVLGSHGAYSLFNDERIRDLLVNEAGEFVYSTALSPVSAQVAQAAVHRVAELAAAQPAWHELSRRFRGRLRADGWQVPEGDSPIVPLRLDDPAAAMAAAEWLRGEGILAGAVRPPTVPKGTSRLRFSLKRTMGAADIERVAQALAGWRRR